MSAWFVPLRRLCREITRRTRCSFPRAGGYAAFAALGLSIVGFALGFAAVWAVSPIPPDNPPHSIMEGFVIRGDPDVGIPHRLTYFNDPNDFIDDALVEHAVRVWSELGAVHLESKASAADAALWFTHDVLPGKTFGRTSTRINGNFVDGWPLGPEGSIRLNVASDYQGQLSFEDWQSVIAHEMGHTLGAGDHVNPEPISFLENNKYNPITGSSPSLMWEFSAWRQTDEALGPLAHDIDDYCYRWGDGGGVCNVDVAIEVIDNSNPSAPVPVGGFCFQATGQSSFIVCDGVDYTNGPFIRDDVADGRIEMIDSVRVPTTFMEVSAPNGFPLNPFPLSVTLRQQDLQTVTFYTHGVLRIEALDTSAGSDELLPITTVPIDDACYGVVNASAGGGFDVCDNSSADLDTSDSGVIELVLPAARYVVVNTRYPSGYAPDLATTQVFPSPEGDVGLTDDPVTVQFYYLPRSFKLRIVSSDSISGAPSGGACYEAVRGLATTSVCDDDGDGIVEIDNPTLGDYTITQTQPPVGWLPADPSQRSVNVTGETALVEVAFVNAEDPDAGCDAGVQDLIQPGVAWQPDTGTSAFDGAEIRLDGTVYNAIHTNDFCLDVGPDGFPVSFRLTAHIRLAASDMDAWLIVTDADRNDVWTAWFSGTTIGFPTSPFYNGGFALYDPFTYDSPEGDGGFSAGGEVLVTLTWDAAAGELTAEFRQGSRVEVLTATQNATDYAFGPGPFGIKIAGQDRTFPLAGQALTVELVEIEET